MPIMGGYEALNFIKDAYKRFHHSNLIYGDIKELGLIEKKAIRRSSSLQNIDN
jgi:hypothetical protein